MNKTILPLLLTLGVSVTTAAHEKKHSHKAHVHGSGKIMIAFDGTAGKAEIEMPADSVLGFEHKPKNLLEEKRTAEALSKIENNFSKMLVFSPELKCEVKKDTLAMSYEGTHADVKGAFSIACARSPLGTVVELHFFQSWLKAKTIEAQFLVDAVQKSLKHTKNGQSVELK